jgi:hypothetical protein
VSAARRVLTPDETALFLLLRRFTNERLAAAGTLAERLQASPGSTAGAELHAFLRECWEALDGLAREVNLVMHRLFPAARLFPPLEMTRQCTFYTVRKVLHEHPHTSEHPVSCLLWQRTRSSPDETYCRLSFLYNLSLFLPVPVLEGHVLPGTGDVPAAARGIIRQPPAGDVARCGLSRGVEGILQWLTALVVECRRLLEEALAAFGGPIR